MKVSISPEREANGDDNSNENSRSEKRRFDGQKRTIEVGRCDVTEFQPIEVLQNSRTNTALKFLHLAFTQRLMTWNASVQKRRSLTVR